MAQMQQDALSAQALQQAAQQAAIQQQQALAALAAQQQQALAALAAQQAEAQKAALKAAEEAQAMQAALAAQEASMKAAENGMTYIDVSLDNQILTYFVNGAPVLTTPCVTGGPRNSTPRGVFAINSLVPGKYLSGPTWHVWVNRWMRFCGNCGIHDASWRRSFGGNIYRSNGSHGCVNIPPSVANQLYGMVTLGTVVIVH
ncbi:MAG: L,D-transpeptidase [Lachnospiraceae bacterium]|nr:L,D-transpeptidase [Lachnospiraceae bacterium]